MAKATPPLRSPAASKASGREGLPQALSRSTLRWWSKAVNFSCLLSLAVLRTPASPWDTLFPLGVGLVLDPAVFSLVCALSSPSSAQDESCLFGRFTGTTAQSDPSGTYMSAVRLSAFSDRSRSDRDIPEVSRFSCMLFLDYAGPDAHSRSNANAVWPSHLSNEVGTLKRIFRSSIARPADAPVYASNVASRRRPQDTGSRWIRYLLPCRTLSFPTSLTTSNPVQGYGLKSRRPT